VARPKEIALRLTAGKRTVSARFEPVLVLLSRPC
jgi:hypothetical protein